MAAKIHLITYATKRFKHRQILLGLSAKWHGVVDTVTHWSPELLVQNGFYDEIKNISLSERGSGFWVWKPFIIARKLGEVNDGDIVFYCDVGRTFPYKLLDQSIQPYLTWMNQKNQNVLPGIEIPWSGANKNWIKREAFTALGLDDISAHHAIPIQASFSFWRANEQSRKFTSEWLNYCKERNLVSDDPSESESPELEGFIEHRHDQALLSLCCIKHNISGLNIGAEKPTFDDKNPSAVSRDVWGENNCRNNLLTSLLTVFSNVISQVEKVLRKKLSFQ